MRLFAICLLFLSLAIHVIGQNSKPDTNKSNDNGQQAADAKNPVPEVIIQSQSNQQTSDKQDAAPKNAEHSLLPSPEWITAGSTFCILLATTAYAVISYCMLRRIGRQVVLAGVSARAAHRNAQALINAERPWVVPRIKRVVKLIDTVVTEDGANAGEPCKRHVTYFTFHIKNHGRTPAEIISVRGYPEITYDGINGGFTDPPDYGSKTIFRQVRMLAPDQTWVYEDVELNPWSYISTSQSLEKDLRESPYLAHIIFKGVILYRDAFRPTVTHESRFCYTYLCGLDNYRPSGPPEHTMYT
jgi:hypothetical protein